MQEIIIDRACGLDVHKASVTACIKGKNLKKQIRTFGTTTKELIELKNWLQKNKITHLAMESTGVYWKPVFNILEDYQDLEYLDCYNLWFTRCRKIYFSKVLVSLN